MHHSIVRDNLEVIGSHHGGDVYAECDTPVDVCFGPAYCEYKVKGVGSQRGREAYSFALFPGRHSVVWIGNSVALCACLTVCKKIGRRVRCCVGRVVQTRRVDW